MTRDQADMDRKLAEEADEQIRQTQEVIRKTAESIKRNQEYLDRQKAERHSPLPPSAKLD